MCAGGTVTCSRNGSPSSSRNVKNEQHSVSLRVRSRTRSARPGAGASVSASSVGPSRCTPRTAAANNASNSASRNGWSDEGSVQAAGAQSVGSGGVDMPRR